MPLLGVIIGAVLGLVSGVTSQWLMTNYRDRLAAIEALHALQAEVASNSEELNRALAGFALFQVPVSQESLPAEKVTASLSGKEQAWHSSQGCIIFS